MANLHFDMLDLSDMEECLAESDRGVLDSSLCGKVSGESSWTTKYWGNSGGF